MNDTKISISGNQMLLVFITNHEIIGKGFHALIMESKYYAGTTPLDILLDWIVSWNNPIHMSDWICQSHPLCRHVWAMYCNFNFESENFWGHFFSSIVIPVLLQQPRKPRDYCSALTLFQWKHFFYFIGSTYEISEKWLFQWKISCVIPVEDRSCKTLTLCS